MTVRAPTSILICALGGEGGASIARWITEAAEREGHWVQSTSIPGVAQRTGATTYYIEVAPAGEGATPPLMALSPSPGAVDVVLASEMLEAGRAMQAGYVSPDRTVLVAAQHRVYAVAEKSAMGDGRYDAAIIENGARKLARQCVVRDMSQVAATHRVPVTMVLLGAAAPFLPVQRQTLEAVLADAHKDGRSLRAFAAGWDMAAGSGHAAPDASSPRVRPRPASFNLDGFPPEARATVESGLRRLLDYQDADYASLYLSRIEPIVDLDRRLGGQGNRFRLTVETARHAALWMSYEDLIRVADLKTRRERIAQVQRDAGAGENQPVRIIEYLKPGVEELCSVLPGFLASPIRRLADRYRLGSRLNVGMRVASNEFPGFLVFRALALLRRFRRRTSRWRQEQRAIERWLAAVESAAALDLELGCAIAECAGLIKGYGETHKRGVANFEQILACYDLGCRAGWDYGRLAELVQSARAAALGDPEGDALQRLLAERRPRFARTEGETLAEETI